MSFLSSMLPSVVGIGVGAMTGNPMLGAAVAGGLGYAKSGSLMQGITAGLGAYGGAQLAGGLAELGTSEIGANATDAAAKQVEEAVAQRNAQIAAAQQAGGYDMLEPLSPVSQQQQAAMKAGLIDQAPVPSYADTMKAGISAALDSPSKLVSQMGGGWNTTKAGLMAAAPVLSATTPQYEPIAPKSTAQIAPRYRYDPGVANPLPSPSARGVEQNYFPTRGYSQITNDQAKQLYGFADGGMTYGDGDTQGDPNLMQVKTFDPVIRMAGGGTSLKDKRRTQLDDTVQAAYEKAEAKGDEKSVRAIQQEQDMRNAMYGGMKQGLSSVPGLYGAKGLSDMPGLNETKGLYAAGGLSDLGGYSDGGRLLRGPGDGVSDSIPAMIGKKQPARLADGEFVVPARIVSELGNGSTEAGARQLYAMMDRVQKARGKTVGKGKIAKRTNPNRLLPA